MWTASHDASQHATLMDHNNFTDFPIPTGVRRQQLISLREKRESMPWSASFVGSIERTCLPRIVYLIALQGNDHISFDLSSHLADGLTPDQSFAQYLNRLTSTQVNVNFSLRSNGAAIRTGRIMETIGSAGLLVQEYCPLIRRWFSEDKHFIGFTNEIDLRETLDKIVTDPKRYQEIRLAGTNFYEQNYSPIQMTKHLSSFRY